MPNNSVDGELKGLRSDISRLRSDFGKFFDDAGNLAKTGTQSGVAQSKEALDSLAETAKEHKVSVEDRIKDNPLAAIAMAFGTGVLLASLKRK